MEQINTASRIHPLMAAAAVSVIAVSVAGTAAITGLLPSSKADSSVAAAPQALVAPQALAAPVQAAIPPALVAQPAPTAQQLADAQMLVAKYSPQVAQPEPERVVEKPVVKKVVHRTPQRNHVAQHREPTYRAQPVQQQAKTPNYVGIGTGAVIGGLIGNQIGGGNGKKIATVAGVIGGGFLGNEIANRNK